MGFGTGKTEGGSTTKKRKFVVDFTVSFHERWGPFHFAQANGSIPCQAHLHTHDSPIQDNVSNASCLVCARMKRSLTFSSTSCISHGKRSRNWVLLLEGMHEEEHESKYLVYYTLVMVKNKAPGANNERA